MYQKNSFIGNLGKDPEMKYAPNGDAVTSLNVATNRKYKGKDGQTVKETIWFRVTVWRKQAESCNQYLKKGSLVYIEGRLQADKATGGPRIWTRQDGTAGASFEVTASEVIFLSPNGDGTHSEVSMAGGEDADAGGEDNIPF